MYELKLLTTFRYHVSSLHVQPEKPTKVYFNEPTIVFVTDNNIETDIIATQKRTCIMKKQIFLLSSQVSTIFYSGSESNLICLHIPHSKILYAHYLAIPLTDDNININGGINPINMKPGIEMFVNDIKQYVGINCQLNKLIGIKTLEFLELLKIYYSTSEITTLFSSLLDEDYKFAYTILSNYSEAFTAQELCRLSSYNYKYFEKKFKRIFGLTPYQWMLERKKSNVYYEIIDTEKPLKAIALDNGFSNFSNFGDFCRKHFEDSPSCLRKNQMQGKNLAYK